MSPFIPTLVCGHTATLIDNKLYILGGRDKYGQFDGKEFFYLDVSIPFNTQNLLWHDLSSINVLKMYLWGGCSDSKTYFNDMLILDTISLSWEKGSGCNDDSILIPETTITKGNALTLNEVYIYDIINDNWSTKMTSGKIPSNRLGFSSTLGLDGQRIIIFGGAYHELGNLDTSLYVLNLTNFNWYIPYISGKIPTPRLFHKANVIGKYIAISFGKGYDKSIESDILLLDISNNEEYVWTTTFDPSVPNNTLTTPLSSSSPLQPSKSNSKSNGKSNGTSNITPATLIGIIVGSLIGVNSNYQEEITIPTQENIHNCNKANNSNYNHGQEIIQVPTINENSTKIIPTPVINKNYGQEIMQQTPHLVLKIQAITNQ
ncbi:hypothetical protein C1645_877785 [Glomus cerebriforme]|uniref:Galactose oxidase n=1 Tax=Glomus cerebriforme TaxID=658196 RepID=A0A397SUW9_9GLOM|nr:hypothetical protein C1645_877785 [Glomus cerebriforme]